MSLSGVHFKFTNVALRTSAPGVPLAGNSGASQTMSVPGVSAIAVTGDNCLVSISASGPIFYALGASPDAVSGSLRHYYDPATGGPDTVFANTGDKLAWVWA